MPTLGTSDDLAMAWRSLQQEEWTHPGAYERRLAADSVHVAYAVLVRPAGTVGLALELPVAVSADISEDAARGFLLRKEWKRESGKVRFSLTLSDPRYLDVFGILALDVLTKILRAKTVEGGGAALRDRLAHWKRFLKAAGEYGLSIEAQTGLYGELFVLRRLLLTGRGEFSSILTSWKGPYGANQDFSHANRSAEVKTTTSNDIESVRIVNERQLDEEGLDDLLLCHVVLDRRQGAGETLPQIVAELLATLGETMETAFVDLLAMVGYHKVHESRYQAEGYACRFVHIYEVNQHFPRIRQLDLRSGVSEVAYTVNLSSIKPISRDIADLGERLFAGRNRSWT
jgi:hypothetical protein